MKFERARCGTTSKESASTVWQYHVRAHVSCQVSKVLWDGTFNARPPSLFPNLHVSATAAAYDSTMKTIVFAGTSLAVTPITVLPIELVPERYAKRG